MGASEGTLSLGGHLERSFTSDRLLEEILRQLVVLEIYEQFPRRLTRPDDPRLVPFKVERLSPSSGEPGGWKVVILASDPGYESLLHGTPLESIVVDTARKHLGADPQIEVRTVGMVRLREAAEKLDVRLPPL